MNTLKAILLFTVLFLGGCAQSHLDIFPELEDPSLMDRKISVAELHQDIDAYVAGVRARHPDFDGYADEQALQKRVAKPVACAMHSLRSAFHICCGQCLECSASLS